MATTNPPAARILMSNNPTDPYVVRVVAKINTANGWSCATLENARRSARLFLSANKHCRSRADIYRRKDGQIELI